MEGRDLSARSLVSSFISAIHFLCMSIFVKGQKGYSLAGGLLEMALRQL